MTLECNATLFPTGKIRRAWRQMISPHHPGVDNSNDLVENSIACLPF